MAIERIVSFLPSATELIFELGLGEKLVGVTHECTYPVDAKNKPHVIDSVFDSNNLSSKEIDQITTGLMREGKEIFKLNDQNLKRAKPDLIIYQNTCEVCAAHTNQITQALEILEKKPMTYSMDPHNLVEIIESVIEFAKIVGEDTLGTNLKKQLQIRVDRVKNQIFKSNPKVLALEWIDPFFTAGHWIPEMISIAGGACQISKIGEHSRRMEIKEIQDCDPDIIVLMPCGFNITKTINEYQSLLKENKDWNELRAVQNSKIFAVDADSFFSKPSIRTITGLEILAKIIHPENFQEAIPQHAIKIVK